MASQRGPSAVIRATRGWILPDGLDGTWHNTMIHRSRWPGTMERDGDGL